MELEMEEGKGTRGRRKKRQRSTKLGNRPIFIGRKLGQCRAPLHYALPSQTMKSCKNQVSYLLKQTACKFGSIMRGKGTGREQGHWQRTKGNSNLGARVLCQHHCERTRNSNPNICWLKGACAHTSCMHFGFPP